MICIIDLTDPNIPLLKNEFVEPIVQIVSHLGYSYEIIRLEDNIPLSSSIDAILICGTALADHWYISKPLPSYFTTFTKPILGICAGMQMLIASEGGVIISCLEIGMREIRFIPGINFHSNKEKKLFVKNDSFHAYSLHQQAVICRSPYIAVAESDCCVQICCHTHLPRYGVLFHPEVRNEWIIERFLLLTKGDTEDS